MNFIKYKEHEPEVYHELINIEFACEVDVPHEWYFLNLFTRQELRKNQELASILVKFVLEFYPEYSWTVFDSEDEIATAVIECELCSYTFLQRYKYGILGDVEMMHKAMAFGDIVTDFLIRFQNYSLIKSSGQNIIITASSNCHKKFEDLLIKGYTIQRKAKMYYKDGFHKLPVLPTRNSDYPFEELIEIENGEYAKVYSIRKQKKN